MLNKTNLSIDGFKEKWLEYQKETEDECKVKEDSFFWEELNEHNAIYSISKRKIKKLKLKVKIHQHIRSIKIKNLYIYKSF